MTSFVHLEYSTKHPGVARVESAIDAAQHMGRGFSGTRGLATLLLSAVAAAVMVVAYQVMDTVAEGHLLVMWIALWGAAFAALAFFAGAARVVAVRVVTGLDAWSLGVARSRADERLWASAQSDSRVMADLQSAMTRQQLDSAVAPTRVEAALPAGLTQRALRLGGAELRAFQRQYI